MTDTSPQPTRAIPAAWYDDPASPGRLRYWDGEHWTEQTAPAMTPQEPAGVPAQRAAPAPVPAAPTRARGQFRLGSLAFIGIGVVLMALGAVVFMDGWLYEGRPGDVVPLLQAFLMFVGVAVAALGQMLALVGAVAQGRRLAERES